MSRCTSHFSTHLSIHMSSSRDGFLFAFEDGFALYDPFAASPSPPVYLAPSDYVEGHPYHQHGEVRMSGLPTHPPIYHSNHLHAYLLIYLLTHPSTFPISQVRLNDGRCDRHGRFIAGTSLRPPPTHPPTHPPTDSSQLHQVGTTATKATRRKDGSGKRPAGSM